MSILGILGGAAGYALGGMPGATLGAQIGGGIDTNQARADAAASANEFSANQYATRYQTQVKDLEAAGLNPMMAYMQSPGSSPTGQSYQPSNPYEGVSHSYSSAANIDVQRRKIVAEAETEESRPANVRADTFLKEAQHLLAGATADQTRATINLYEHKAKKISEEIKNIPKEGDRLIALINNLKEELPLIKERVNTQQQMTNHFRWLAVKAAEEAELLDFDIEAIIETEGYGRLARELKPISDIASDWLSPGKLIDKLLPGRKTRSRGTYYDRKGEPSGGYSSETQR